MLIIQPLKKIKKYKTHQERSMENCQVMLTWGAVELGIDGNRKYLLKMQLWTPVTWKRAQGSSSTYTKQLLTI